MSAAWDGTIDRLPMRVKIDYDEAMSTPVRAGEQEITEEERALIRERKAEFERNRNRLDGNDRIEKIRQTLKHPAPR